MPVYPPSFTDQQIANQLTREGLHWATTTITYSFNDFSTAGNALNATQRGWINKAIAQVEDILNLSFTETGTTGDITFNGTSGNGTFAGLNWSVPSNAIDFVDIEFDQSWTSNQTANLDYGSYGFMTILHEFMHAIGVEHPGTYDAATGVVSYFPDAEFRQDTHRYTVMSYFDADADGTGTSQWFYNGTDFDWLYPQTLMIYDILALTEGNFAGDFAGYGFNLSTRTGATTYGYNASAGIDEVYDFAVNGGPVLTIYDAGGIDTLDLSGDTISQKMVINYNAAGIPTTPTQQARTSSIIDLREGAFSSTHGMDNNIGIAFGTVIENAVGTQFDDLIHGNAAQNNLRGGAGDDFLRGWQGNDVLIGGAGADRLDGGTGVDTVDYSSSSVGVSVRLVAFAIASGGDAAGDTFIGVENVVGSNFNDYLLGSSAANNLAGGSGNDQIMGSAGADQMAGGAGAADHLNYSNSTAAVTVNLSNNTASRSFAAGDTISGFEWLTGSNFDDILTGSNSANRLFGRDGTDILNGLGGNDRLDGGTGDDTINGGTAQDILTGGIGSDVFLFTDANFGQDTIVDWDNGFDKLDLRSLGLTFASFQKTLVGADTVLTLTSNPLHKITFVSTALNLIDAGDFLV